MQNFKASEVNREDILKIAEKMRNDNRRLLMIYGYVDKEGSNVVSYQYEVGDTVEAYHIKGEKTLPSISHIYDVSAAWPEEEIFELMGIEFEGLERKGRLFMPDSMVDGGGKILVTPMEELKKMMKGEKEE